VGEGKYMEVYNVHQALKILQQYYITDSIQMVTRWIREGKIKAERSANRREGWRIHKEDLFDFIEEQRPGLPEIMAVHEWYVENAFSPMVNDDHGKMSEVNSENVKDVNTSSQELIEQLMEEKKQLDSKLINMQAELNLVYEKVVELTTEIQNLKEENDFLRELYEQTDEMYQELKKKNQQESSNETPKAMDQQKNTSKTSKTMERKLNKAMSFGDFKDILKKTINEHGSEIKDLVQQEEELTKEIYTLFFNEDEKLKDEITNGDQYNCPLTGKRYKNLKSMLKHAIRYKLEKMVNQVKEEMVANDSNR
jgi:DNA repair exonuclease SbcCD ATPase subunit